MGTYYLRLAPLSCDANGPFRTLKIVVLTLSKLNESGILSTSTLGRLGVEVSSS